MTMAEFNLRFFGYYKQEKRDWEKIYEISKNVIGSSMLESKSKKSFINDIHRAYIGVSKPKLNDFQKKIFEKAREEKRLYLKNKNKSNG